MSHFRRQLTIFTLMTVLVTVLTGALSSPLSRCETTAHPDDGPCRTQSAAKAALASRSEAPADPAEDCCTTGCQDCTLPCCARMAIVLTGLSPLDGPDLIGDALGEPEVLCPPAEADSQYRPPRA